MRRIAAIFSCSRCNPWHKYHTTLRKISEKALVDKALCAQVVDALREVIYDESKKLNDRDTAEKCRARGIRLVPVVAESLGGWGTEANKVFKTLGCQLATQTGESHGATVSQLYEHFSVKLMCASARSSLARAADASVACP